MFISISHINLIHSYTMCRVMQLNQEIEKVKEAQMAGFSRGGQTEQNVQLNLGALAALDAADLGSTANGECSYHMKRTFLYKKMDTNISSLLF